MRVLNTGRSILIVQHCLSCPPSNWWLFSVTTPTGHPFIKRDFKSTSSLWDVDTALTYIRLLSGNDALSLKILKHKLSVLLALTAPKKTSELRLLDIRFMRILPEGVEFKLPGMTKTSSDIKTVFFARYEACEQLCVLHCLQSYLVQLRLLGRLAEWPLQISF